MSCAFGWYDRGIPRCSAPRDDNACYFEPDKVRKTRDTHKARVDCEDDPILLGGTLGCRLCLPDAFFTEGAP
jgi:hypothetical protein